jgi:hypothetical protein
MPSVMVAANAAARDLLSKLSIGAPRKIHELTPAT